MTAAHFQNLPIQLSRYLEQARQSLRIAVCWFSHRDLFDILLEKLRAGIRIELLIEYDSQNIRDGGLDFQRFIHAGGQLFARRGAGLMHHKFAILDDALLLTGSFNWTYNANAENFLATDAPALIAAFRDGFEREKTAAKRIFQIRREEVKVFSAYPLFENTHFQLNELRRAISVGAGAWLVRLEKCGRPAEQIFRENLLLFDRAGLLGPFWATWRVWDEKYFDEGFSNLTVGVSPTAGRELRRWSRRMRTGDLVFATLDRRQLLALGVVQSPPRHFAEPGFSSCRDVQWLRRLDVGEPYFLAEKGAAAGLARFRGSALRVVQEILG